MVDRFHFDHTNHYDFKFPESVISIARPYDYPELLCNDCQHYHRFDGRFQCYEVCDVNADFFSHRWHNLMPYHTPSCESRKIAPKQLELF